jgi:hypothetical protein
MSFGSLGADTPGLSAFPGYIIARGPHISPAACWRIFHRGERIFAQEACRAGKSRGPHQEKQAVVLSPPPWPSTRLGGADLRSPSPLSFLTKDQFLVRRAAGMAFSGTFLVPTPRTRARKAARSRDRNAREAFPLSGDSAACVSQRLDRTSRAPCYCLLSSFGARYRFGNRQNCRLIIK